MQLIKAVLVRSKKKNNIKKVNEIGFKSIALLIDNQYLQESIDVIDDMLDIWIDKEVNVTDETKRIVHEINEHLLTANSKPSSHEEDTALKLNKRFLEKAIDWSESVETEKINDDATSSTSNKGKYMQGEPEFHLLLAKTCIELKELEKAIEHFLNSHNPIEFAKFIKMCIPKGYKTEKELFIARSVLQLLAKENLKDANIFFEEFELNISEENHNPVLMNFVKYLLLCLQREAKPLFTTLREKYEPCLKVDPEFNQLLDIIGERFYNIKRQPQGMAGLMQNMMSMFS